MYVNYYLKILVCVVFEMENIVEAVILGGGDSGEDCPVGRPERMASLGHLPSG